MSHSDVKMTSSQDSEEFSDDEYADHLDYYNDDYEEMSGENNTRELPPVPGPSSSSDLSDPENFEFECLEICEVERQLNESVEALCATIPVTPALAKVLLHNHEWKVGVLVDKYQTDCHRLLVDTHLKPPQPVPLNGQRVTMCLVCARSVPSSEFRGLACGHQYCRHCWTMHCESQLLIGVSTNIECMESKCRLLAPEDFLYNVLSGRPDLRAKYQQFVFQDHVKSQPELRFCPGANCPIVIRAPHPKAKKVTCKNCKLVFCFSCGMEYHAPTGCETIKRWVLKCADDSETANYITANTKDCPHCHACIEKNGGCNHMQCTKCKHHFCWMCLGDWKSHGSEYYECSRYKENPAIANENVHVKARAALEKYLFYFERWENHAKSLKLEEQLFGKIQQRVVEKTTEKEGTWIDWQFLYRAAELLTRCRYTLQYTYPYAYYSEAGTRKELFEYQQAQLEKEIEELSWKVERAETKDKGAMERQMHIAELKRRTLLQDFYG